MLPAIISKYWPRGTCIIFQPCWLCSVDSSVGLSRPRWINVWMMMDWCVQCYMLTCKLH